MEDLSKELSGLKSIQEQVLKKYKSVTKAVADQRERVNNSMDYWDCYNCKLNHNQAYEVAISRIYVPIVHDAIEARVTRFSNQIFPTNGRYVEVITEDGEFPYAHMALLENYVRKAKLRTEVIPALMRNGDIEGQYSVYVSWKKDERSVRYRKREKVEIEDIEYSIDLDDIDDVDTIVEEELTEGFPHVEVISDSDLIIEPFASDSVEDAIEKGGSVTMLMRMTEGQIDKMVADGVFDKRKADVLKIGFGDVGVSQGAYGARNAEKQQAAAAGVQIDGGVKVAHIYQTWTKLKVGKENRLCVVYYGGNDLILSAKLNPYWCDLCPIISVPIRKMSAVVKGVSMVECVAQLQYAANDAANLGMTSGIFSLQPIIMTDPEKNPRIGSMLMNIGAIWQTSPNDTQVVTFPELFGSAWDIVNTCKGEIFQALGVNPAMITQGSAYRKATQAEVANEQMVDVLTTADAVTIIEEGIMTPMIERFYDYDRQFRKDSTTVRAFGSMGLRASMEVIEPIQENNRYTFRWLGVEQARTMQRIQQQISAINVIRGIPPQLLPGRRLDMVPFIEALAENAFGPRLAPLVFVDEREKLAVSPNLENDMLARGFEVSVHEMEDDLEHIRVHMEVVDLDQSGFTRIHILAHQEALLAKQQEVSMGIAQTAQPAGGATVPQAGVSPAGPSNTRQPAGAIHPDQMPGVMPRNM